MEIPWSGRAASGVFATPVVKEKHVLFQFAIPAFILRVQRENRTAIADFSIAYVLKA